MPGDASVGMDLSDPECAFAQEIKKEIEASETLKSVTDMDVAQMALASLARQDGMEVALENLYKMQCFREVYRIHDTLEEGMQLIREFLEHLLPGAILSIDYSMVFGNFIWTMDYAAFYPHKVNFPNDWRIFMGGTYYMLHCMCPNLQAMRGGLVQICECEGVGSQHISIQMGERWLNEILNFYPFIHKETMWLNTPMALNVAYACLKSMFSPQVRDSLRLGCKLDGYEGRIDALFKSPTAEIAHEQLLQRIGGYLSERFRNQNTFVLPEPSGNLGRDDDDNDDDDDDDTDMEDVNEEAT